MNKEPDIFQDIDEDELIILSDENGKDCRFQLLDMVDYNGREFIVLLSEEEAVKEDCDVDILEVVTDKANPELENYLPVEDDSILEAVFELFAESNKDILDFC